MSDGSRLSQDKKKGEKIKIPDEKASSSIVEALSEENFTVEKCLVKPSSRSIEMEDFQNDGFMKDFFNDWRAEASEITKNCQKIVSREQDMLDKCVTAQIHQNQEILSLLKNVVQNQNRQQNS